MNTVLNGARLDRVMAWSMYRESELSEGKVPDDAVQVGGLVSKFAFHPDRIKEATTEVNEMLSQLPKEFHEKTGGGWSFLNGCMDKFGDIWTDYQSDVEKLVVLGLATNQVSYLLPRDMWNILPGGVPYFMVKDNHA